MVTTNIAVFGSDGSIGNYIRKYSKLKKNMTFYSRKYKNNFFDIKISNVENILTKKKFTRIVFLISFTRPEKCFLKKKLSYEINVKKTKKFLKYLIKRKIYFIFFSSEYVFSGKNNKKYRENDKKNSRMTYGLNKIEIESFLNRQLTKNFSILRLGKVYDNSLSDNSFFSNLIKYSKKNKSVYVADDQYFSPVFSRDLVKIIDIFLKKQIAGTFNICGDQSFSRYEFAQKLFKLLKINTQLIPIKFNQLKMKENFSLNTTMSNKKIKKRLNFKFCNFEKNFKT
ncbi:dTDP-4-dehydrorhamnose reductase [alpha proteobacterium HIMB114]|nr:dTDP-4-dehydrorhamnose reductase [alpha proteobacterium HIMB114]